MLSMPRTVLLIIGLPGSGKTVLAKKLQEYLNCLWFNADKVRATISEDLGFTDADRMKQARRLGQMCALALEYESSRLVLVDFVCPTELTRMEFRKALLYPSTLMQESKAQNVHLLDLPDSPSVFTIFMNTLKPGDSRFPDTAKLFEKPDRTLVDLTVDAFPVDGDASHNLLKSITRVVDSSRMPGMVMPVAPRGWTFDGRMLKL